MSGLQITSTVHPEPSYIQPKFSFVHRLDTQSDVLNQPTQILAPLASSTIPLYDVFERWRPLETVEVKVGATGILYDKMFDVSTVMNLISSVADESGVDFNSVKPHRGFVADMIVQATYTTMPAHQGLLAAKVLPVSFFSPGLLDSEEFQKWAMFYNFCLIYPSQATNYEATMHFTTPLGYIPLAKQTDLELWIATWDIPDNRTVIGKELIYASSPYPYLKMPLYRFVIGVVDPIQTTSELTTMQLRIRYAFRNIRFVGQ